MFDLFSPLTHDNLLKILPFGCGYMTDEYGDPDPTSLRLALLLRATVAVYYPKESKRAEIN
jgi:hypothetical protein